MIYTRTASDEIQPCRLMRYNGRAVDEIHAVGVMRYKAAP